jgi:hypothetical protein
VLATDLVDTSLLLPSTSRAGTTTNTETIHVHSISPKVTLEPVFQYPGIRPFPDEEFSVTSLEKDSESESSKRTFSFLELLSTKRNKAPAVTLFNDSYAEQTITTDVHKGSGSSMNWEGSHDVTEEAEPSVPSSSFITSTKDASSILDAADVVTDNTIILGMSKTVAPSAGYIMSLTEDSSRPSYFPHLQMPLSELESFKFSEAPHSVEEMVSMTKHVPSLDSFFDKIGELSSHGLKHGQTVAKNPPPISVNVTHAETNPGCQSTTSSEGGIRLALASAKPFQTYIETNYVLASLAGHETLETASPSNQIVISGLSSTYPSKAIQYTSSSLPVTPTTPAANDVEMDGSKASRSLPRQSLKYILGTLSGACVVVVCIAYLYKPCYRWARQSRRGTIKIAYIPEEYDANTERHLQGFDQVEISRFSLDS